MSLIAFTLGVSKISPMSDQTFPNLDLREQVARIDRAIAETGRLQEETHKFVTEQAKLVAEQANLTRRPASSAGIRAWRRSASSSLLRPASAACWRSCSGITNSARL
jgi:hypothetical protein